MPYKLIPPGKRGASWYVRGRDASGRFEYSTGQRTRGRAATWSDDFVAKRASRRVPGAGEAVGFYDAAQFYKAAKPHLSKVDIRQVDAVAAEIGNADCRTVVHATLVAAADAIKPGRSDATKNRKVVGPGAAVLHYAAEQRWCEYQRLKKFWESRKSSRDPARDEDIRLIVANVEAPARKKTRGRKKDHNVAYKRLLLEMLYETGLRLGHLLSVTWRNIDLKAGRVRVRIPKSDEIASLPLSRGLVATLANLPAHGKPLGRPVERAGRLFPWSTNRGVYAWLKPLTGRLGVTYTPHMSRHKLATDASDAMIPDKKAAELGVWQDPRSLHRYQHVTPDAIKGRSAAVLLGFRREKGSK